MRVAGTDPSPGRKNPARTHSAAVGRRGWMIGLFGPATVLAVCTMLSAPAMAAPSSGHNIWKPPYTGATSALDPKSSVFTLACGSASSGPNFARSTGAVRINGSSFAATADSSSCASNYSLSQGKSTQILNIFLPGFSITGHSGVYKIDATWNVSSKIQLFISGSNCSQAEVVAGLALDVALIGYNSTTKVRNLTSIDGWVSPLYNETIPLANNGSVTKTTTHRLDRSLSLGGNVSLSKSDTYFVRTFILLFVYASVDNPITTQTTANPASCTADARITPTHGAAVATLAEVVEA